MTTEEVIQMRIRSLRREIDDLERTKAVMVNETARKATLTEDQAAVVQYTFKDTVKATSTGA